MTKCKHIIIFLRLVLLTEIISYGILTPKYNTLIQRINVQYKITLKSLEQLPIQKISILSNEIRYDILKAKRESKITQLSLLN